MMKRRKMLLSMMLTVGLTVGMLPVTALAAENEAGEPTEITVQVEEEASEPAETAVQAEEEVSEPAETAVQAEGWHVHPLCGNECNCSDVVHNGTTFGQTLNSSNGTLTIAGKEATQDADGKYELSAGEYYLADNVDLDKGITIQGNVQICLNNKQIRLSNKGAVFTVNNNGNELTLTDCGENGAVSHSATYLGSGVAVNDGAALSMYGGEISNNASANGVRMIGGSFNMYGGRITNNTDTSSGGGVYAYKSTFNMYGGEISGNRVENANYGTNGGGGVWVKDGTFRMSGGSITGNTACRNGSYGQGGGVRCIGNTKVELSGSPVIKDNGLTTGEVNNLYADTGSSNVTITGQLTTGAEIHMVKNGENAATVASGVDALDANQYIFCDDTGYEASYDADSNMITWTVPTHTHVWGEWFSNGNGTHSHTCESDGIWETYLCYGGDPATCQKKSVCVVCHTEYGELNSANHAGGTEVRDYVAATAEAAGYTGDTWCKGCNTKIAEGTTIPKLDGGSSTPAPEEPDTPKDDGNSNTPAPEKPNTPTEDSSSDDDDDDTPAVNDNGHNTSAGAAAASPVIEDYIIKRGDTLGTIARKYGCTVAEIVAANKDLIKNPNRIYAGWKLTIPQKGATATAVNQSDNRNAGVYTIKRGDSLWAIARRYGCTVADIVKMNSSLITMPDRIRVGWELKMPVK